MKIVVVTNIPSPYRIPLFNQMHTDFKSKGWHLKVIFLTRKYARRKWNVHENEFIFDFKYLNDIQFTIGEGFTSLAISLPGILYHEKPDAIIVGGFSLPTLWIYLYSRLFRVPYIIWSGETPRQSKSRNDLFRLGFLVRKFQVSNAFAGVAYGTEAKNYLCHMGLPPESVFIGINTVDTRFFQQACTDVKLNKEILKTEKGFPPINILYVGHLTKLKGIHYLIQAFRHINHDSCRAVLHIVGDGEYQNALENMVQELELTNKVNFWGFKQKEELPFFYGIADFFVFPSLYDVWGLVCIEAMSAHLPVISSFYSGVTSDLLRNGVNGFVIKPEDTMQFAKYLEQLILDVALREKFALAASTTVEKEFLIEHSAKGFVRAVDYCLSKGVN